MTRLALFCSFGLLFTATCIANDAEQRILERYKEILVNAPKRGATFDRVYGHYVDIGQSADLYLDCQKATQENPSDANAWILLGLVAERRGRSEEAIDAYNNAANLAPDNFLPMLYLGEVLLNQRRFSEAIAALEQANGCLKNSTNRIDRRTVLQTLALAYTRFGEPQKSLEVWNQLAALFPNDPDVLIQVAESMEFDGRLDEALQQYRRLITLTDEPFDRVQLSLAAIDIMLRQGNDDAALNELNTLLGNLDSENYLAESVRDRIDRIFGRNRDIDQQIEFYQNRIEQQPGDRGSLRRLVRTLQRADKIAEAEKLLLETIRVSPANVALRLMLIDILVERHDIGSAVEQFQAIDKIVPNQTDYLIRWGTLALQNPAIEEDERRAEAAKIWTRIAERSPNDPTALVQIADLFSRHRFSDEAERYYKSAMALRPNDFSYREHLARFYHQSRQKEKVLETLLAASPRDAPHAGQLLLTLGYHDEAAEILREAAQSQPQNWTLNLRYLESLLRQDTPESAQAVSEIFVNAGKQIENDEQFALFLQQKIQLLRSLQKTGAAIDIVRAELETAPSARLHWHLAMLHHAEGNFTAAIAALTNNDFHLAGTPAHERPEYRLNTSLLRFAAELYAQVGDTNRAIALYQQLVQDDPARNGNYWQQIITLQIQRGQLNQALETSQNLIGRGTENAERLRFVADLFLSVHRQTEAVRLLRQALVHEPGNTDVLRILAQTLADLGQHEEAIELLWRLYDRLDNFTAKLSVIEILANEYNKLGRGEDLVEHLQHANYERRRESMQALVRVYRLQGDDDEAQYLLETLLDMPDERDISSHWVLRELVALSEQQEDFAVAAQYQEMLCQRSNDPREHHHLFYLYDKLGDTERTRKLFFDQVLRQGNWEERLELIDMMIRREQYDIVAQVLDFLEMHEPENWEVLFRRILVEAHRAKSPEHLVQEQLVQLLRGAHVRRFMELQSLDCSAEQVLLSIVQGGRADWKRTLFYIRTTEYPIEGNDETQLADYIQQVLDELNLTAEDFFPPSVPQAVPLTANVSLVRFRSELQGDRPIDRAIIYPLLPDNESPNDAEQTILSPTEELLLRVRTFRRAHLRDLEQREAVPTQQPGRIRIEVTPVELPEHDPEAELRELVRRLEAALESRERSNAQRPDGTSVDPVTALRSVPGFHTKIALALLYTRLQQYEKTAAVLDAMELTTPSDLLTREWIIARLAVKYNILPQRGNEAADRLLNFRLGERDMLNLVPVLRHFGREEEVQQIWDSLAVTVSDRRLLAELFNEMVAAGAPQRENAAKIAQRILMNPAFLQNSRRLTSDILLLQAAFRMLQSQDRHETVVPVLEARFRGLRDKTDSRIVLARLYLMLDRQEEAKALVLELAQNPTAEPERRQMIVSLLVQFGMQRELEAMNRLLLEKR